LVAFPFSEPYFLETSLMPEPIDPIVADLLNRLGDNIREQFDERAAIMEFEADFPRRLAESLGLLDVLRHNLSGLSGVTGMRVELVGRTQFLAVTDVEHACQHLADIQGKVIAVQDLRVMLEEQYGGIAVLTKKLWNP
jgi:hypothetical protein